MKNPFKKMGLEARIEMRAEELRESILQAELEMIALHHTIAVQRAQREHLLAWAVIELPKPDLGVS